jgi:hypothetical protein
MAWYLPKRAIKITSKNLAATRKFFKKIPYQKYYDIPKYSGDVIYRVAVNELKKRDQYLVNDTVEKLITRHVRGCDGQKNNEFDPVLSFTDSLTEVATWVHLNKIVHGYAKILVCKKTKDFYYAPDHIKGALLRNWAKSSREYCVIGQVPEDSIIDIITI